jgi:hypothetical protein
MGGEGMAEGVGGDALGELGPEAISGNHRAKRPEPPSVPKPH